ncbi:ATP synthase F1 subunit gamma [Cardinium endosymbiont of Tipula unca]|uniref:ATP synthase F1 subunit gamma n=1 Tax=Cardinium endosymbiont of Tipula unca TaxID=3066216 RepID=UPI0030CDC62B
MAHLKEVVDRINLIAYTKQITKSMKMVSASKLHKVQRVLLPLKEYTTACANILQAALQGIDKMDLSHPLTHKKRDIPESFLFIIVASDRGLCGAFNKNILKAAYQQIQTLQQTQSPKIEVITIGKKAYQFFKKYDLTVIDRYVDLLERDNFYSSELTTYCIEAFQQGYYSNILLAYTAFKNAVKQEITIAPFLPFVVDGIEKKASCMQAYQNQYIYEPSQNVLIEKLMRELLKNQVMSMLVESCASEHATRVTTMGKATDNAEELLKDLRVSYNRTRQSLITNSIAEITSGAEALAEA